MSSLLVLWTWVATFNLVWLCYQDLTNNMNVDDRRNYFMLGLSLSLYTISAHSLWYVAAILIVSISLALFINRWRILGEADANTISWLFYGLMVLSIGHFFWFFVFLVILTLIYYLIKKFIFKTMDYSPYYPVILGAFLLIAIPFGMFF